MKAKSPRGKFVPYESRKYDPPESEKRALDFLKYMSLRRTVRDFSATNIPKSMIQNLIMTASTAPSGAHKQPWTFCAVSNPVLKKQIREAAEKEEYESYHNRMSEEWLDALAPLGTDWHKEFLEIAPWLIIVFKKAYDFTADGGKKKNYYVNESVGLACGILLAAIHNAGLVALTHTPSPMNFLQKILKRPENERPFLLIPIGFPADGAQVPDLTRKSEGDVIVYYE
jgi:nitroreductase